MAIPSKNCWIYSEPIGWDEETAIEHFMGVSFESAISMLEESAHFYQEDFYYMPKKPFQFYIGAYVNYLQSEKSKGDCDASSSFILLIEYTLKEKVDYLCGIEGAIEQCLIHIAHRQKWYDAEVEIFGNFHNQIGKIRAKWPHI